MRRAKKNPLTSVNSNSALTAAFKASQISSTRSSLASKRNSSGRSSSSFVKEPHNNSLNHSRNTTHDVSSPFDDDDFNEDVSMNEAEESENIPPRSRVNLDFDPLDNFEDEEIEAYEDDPGKAITQRQNFYAQTQSLAVRMPTDGEIAPEYNGPFFRRLKRLGVDVMRNDENESYFYLGERLHDDLVKLIDERWSSPNEFSRIVEELKDTLKSSYAAWSLFLSPCRNINGIQDTIIRAFVLSSTFQTEIISILYKKLNQMATSNPTKPQIEIGELIILQLRYITQIFNPKAVCIVIFDKPLENWKPELRDKLIEIIPELLTDNSVHSEAARNLLGYITLRGGIEELKSLRSESLKALKFLEADRKTRRKIQSTLMRSLMSFELENISLTIDTVLRILDKTIPGVFKSFLVCLHKFLDIAKLKRNYFDENEKDLNECISHIFYSVAEFMRFNISRCQKDLFSFFAMKKMTRLTAFGNNRMDSDSDDDDDENEEEDDDHHDDESFDGGVIPVRESQRELDLIDVMLLIAFNEATSNTAIILKELRKQVGTSHDNFLHMKQLFAEAITFSTYSKTILPSILNLSQALLQSPNSQLNEIGGVIYKQLFLCPYLSRSEILTCIVSHFSELESETTIALSILEEIAETHIECLRDFLEVLNALLDNLPILSTDNVRRLFFVLVSLNLHQDVSSGIMTQHRRNTQGAKFLKRLNHYLISSVFREVVWGVVGLIQYIKVLLMFSDTIDRDQEIIETLQKVNDHTKKSGGKIRAEFYNQLSELLKPMKKLGESSALITFGKKLTKAARTQFFTDTVSQNSNRSSGNILGNYDDEAFVEPTVGLWINMAELVFAEDDKLDGPICGLLSLLQVVKDFALYRDSLDDDFDSDPHRATFWSSFMFILEANVHLTPLTQHPDLTEHDQHRRCNVLYVTIEYLRTVLNMFAECRYEIDYVQRLMEKKLNLLLYCQNQLQSSIRKLGSYDLPQITKHQRQPLCVKDKENKKIRKPRKKKSNTPEEVEPMEEDQTLNMSDDDMRMFDDDDEERPGSSNTNCSEFFFTSYKLRDPAAPKNITLEQLPWNCTPLKLDTISRLIQIIGFKRLPILNLIENLYVILKHTMPTKERQLSSGFGTNNIPLPYLTMDFGSKESRWNIVASSIPSLFEVLSKTLVCFSTNVVQAPQLDNPHYVNDMTNLLKFSVMIFSRIFQSREISSECDHQDSDKTAHLQSRRSSVLMTLNRCIGLFNSSRLPQSDLSNLTITSNSRTRISEDLGAIGRISDGLENDSNEESVVEFFLNVANYVPTMESASAMLGLLKTFTDLNEFQRSKCAAIALMYLSRRWNDEDDSDAENEKKTIIDKNAYSIAMDFIYFQPDSQKVNSVCWLIWHQLAALYPQEFLESEDFKIGDFQIKLDFVNEYNNTLFPCFQKSNFSVWHKLLFKQFNDSTARWYRVDNKDIVIDSRRFVNEWRKLTLTFYLLSSAILPKKHQHLSVCLTLAREGKRFINFFISKQSSISAFIRMKDLVSKYTDDFLAITQMAQKGNRVINCLRQLGKDKGNATLLKLIPDLQTANEKWIREFYTASVIAGFDKAVSFGILKNKKIGRDEEPKTKTAGVKKGRKKKSDDQAETITGSPDVLKKRPRLSITNVSASTDETLLQSDQKQRCDTTGDASGYVENNTDDESG